MVGELCDDVIGLSQKVGEGAFDYSHGVTISELLQKSTGTDSQSYVSAGADIAMPVFDTE